MKTAHPQPVDRSTAAADVPMQPASWDIWDKKYRLKAKDGRPIDASIDGTCQRVARALAEVEATPELRECWYEKFLWALRHGAIPAGRITSNAGAWEHKPATSTINCTVSGTILDSMDDILRKVHEAGLTLKAGCVAPGSLVFTDHGLVTADAAVNEHHAQILCYDHGQRRFEMHPIERHMKVTVIQEENIEIRSSHAALKTSIKHPVLVYRAGELRYVRADEVTTADALVHHHFPWRADDGRALEAWFAGAHLGDGSAYSKHKDYHPSRSAWRERAEAAGQRLVFKIRAAEREVVERYSRFFAQTFGSAARVVAAQTPNGTPVWDYCVASFTASGAATLIDGQVGEKSHNLHVPGWIATHPEHHFIPFLAGIIDTDGTVSTERGSVTIATASQRFASELANLLAIFGVHAAITQRQPRSHIYKGQTIIDRGRFMVKISDSDFLRVVAGYMADSGKKGRIFDYASQAGQYDRFVMPLELQAALAGEEANLNHIRRQRLGYYHGYYKAAVVSRIWLDRWQQYFPHLSELIAFARTLRPVEAINRNLDLPETFYDFTVEGHNNYLAGNGGLMVIHNCGIGYEFSTLRPRGAYVSGAGAYTSGPLSFMDIYDKMCFTVSSAGGRRGAQMGTFDIGHPDVLEFIRAKRESGRLRQFNLSLLITREFMEAVKQDTDWRLAFPLLAKEAEQDRVNLHDPDQILWREWPTHQGLIVNDSGQVACKIYRKIRARRLWDLIMASTYDYAEPGFILIDRVNEMNNNWFCENIRATNPSLAVGTLVHTRHGIVPIETLADQEFEVRALDGSWGRARCWLSSDRATTLTIHLSNGETIVATPEHQWPVLDRLSGRLVRTPTSALQPGAELPKTLVMPLEIDGDRTLSEDDGFFLGVWLADGHLTRRFDNGALQMGFTFNKADVDMANRILAYVNGRKDRVSHLAEREGSLEFNFQGESVAALAEQFNLQPGEKAFPDIVYRSNDAFVHGFVDGLFSGDGYVAGAGKQRIILRQRSESVIRGVMRLLSFMGITGSLHYSERPSQFPNGKDYGRKYSAWDFKISKIAAKKFARLFTLTCARKQAALAEIMASACEKGLERDLSLTVKAIEKNSEPQPVWDVNMDHPQHLFPISYCYTGNCGEQALPEYGSCLLGSVNLTPFVQNPFTDQARFDWDRYREVVAIFTRMLDNVVEINGLPLEPQRREIFSKRRHGMGYLGLGSTLTLLRMKYGSPESLVFTEEVTREMALAGWHVALELAREKGPAPILAQEFTVTTEMLHQRPELARDGYKAGDRIAGKVLHARYSRYLQRIAEVAPQLVEELAQVGARFTHHTSIAPTGTIALSLANNASNGIEPSFAHHYSRNIIRPGKKSKEKVDVFSFELLAYRHLVNPRAIPDAETDEERLPEYFIAADDVAPKQHVDIQAAAQRWVDSSISKTANVPTDFPYEDFKNIYLYAYEQGLKGCTTFRFNPAAFQGVLVKEQDLANTRYRFVLEDGSEVEVKGNEEIEYDGEVHTAANLFDAIKEGYYGKW